MCLSTHTYRYKDKDDRVKCILGTVSKYKACRDKSTPQRHQLCTNVDTKGCTHNDDLYNRDDDKHITPIKTKEQDLQR